METNEVARVLVTAGPDSQADRVLGILRRGDISLTASEAEDSAQLSRLLEEQGWDLILAFGDNPRLPPRQLLAHLREIQRDIPCLVFIDSSEEPRPLLALGAAEVVAGNELTHDGGHHRLVHRADREIRQLRERRENRRLTVGMQELERRYQRLLETTSDAVACLIEGMHIYANPAWCTFFGYDGEQQLLDIPFLDLVAEADVDNVRDFLRQPHTEGPTRCQFTALDRHGNGQPAVLESAAVPYHGHHGLQVRVTPVTGNIPRENEAARERSRDLVTELLNPISMREALMGAISEAVYARRHSTVLLVAFQGLDEVSRVLGKADTALLLADIGHLLNDLCPAGAIAGRTDSDEFCLLLPGSGESIHRETLQRLETLGDELRPQLPPKLSLTARPGMSVITDEAPDAETVLSRARHNRILRQQQDVELGSVEHSNVILETIQQALANDRLSLVYQPVVSLHEDGIERYEVRSRLIDGDHELHPPEFLEIANQHGMGEQIDRQVIRQALQVLCSSDNPRLRFIINLTQNSLTSSTLLPWLTNEMRERRIGGDRLVLQVSEIDIASAPETVETLCQQLQEPAIAMSVTHFGASLDPLGYLPRIPVHYAKLDRMWLANLDKDASQRERLQALVSSLHARGIRVIAPMIERIEMLPLLWQSQVNFVQGNCLQEPSDSLDFSFLRDEEISPFSF